MPARLVLLVALLTSLAAACGDGADDATPTTAPTATPGEPAGLPYRPDRQTVYAVRPDGSGLRALFDQGDFVSFLPRPGGEDIAVASNDDGEAALFLVDVASAERQLIERRAGFLRLLGWSPDGAWLALFAAEDGAANATLLLYSAESGALSPVAQSAQSRIAGWSPAGDALYLLDGYSPARLRRLALPSMAEEDVAAGLAFDDAVLSPDGSQLALGTYDSDDASPASTYTIDLLDVASAARRELAVLEDTFVTSGLSFSPDGERLTFGWFRIPVEGQASNGIYTVEVATGATARLTEAPEGVDTDAAWSPQGDRLLVTRRVCTQCDGPGSKIVLASPGAAEVALPGTDEFEFGGAAWSPDGARFAYGADALYVAAADGSGAGAIVDLPGASYESIAWTSGGEEVLFLRVAQLAATAYEAPVDGSGLRLLSEPAGALSPDGHFGAIIDYDAAAIVISSDNGKSGSVRHPALTAEAVRSLSLSSLLWSADSTRLAVPLGEKGGESVLVWTDGDLLLVETPGRAGPPRWSPDGARLAYVGERGVEVVATAGGPPELVAEGTALFTALDWSPDGAEIAYLCLDTLYAAPAEGGAPRQVAVLAPSPGNPSVRWSPDGSRIAVGDIRSLRVVSVEGGDVEWTVVAVQEGAAAWSPDGRALAFATAGAGGDEVAGGIHLLDAGDGSLTQVTEATARGHQVLGWLGDDALLFLSLFRL
jgi:Tol biopolymer transport system component